MSAVIFIFPHIGRRLFSNQNTKIFAVLTVLNARKLKQDSNQNERSISNRFAIIAYYSIGMDVIYTQLATLCLEEERDVSPVAFITTKHDIWLQV